MTSSEITDGTVQLYSYRGQPRDKVTLTNTRFLARFQQRMMEDYEFMIG